MKVTLLKNWGDNLKGSEVEVKDAAVLSKGKAEGLFATGKTEEKQPEKKETKKAK